MIKETKDFKITKYMKEKLKLGFTADEFLFTSLTVSWTKLCAFLYRKYFKIKNTEG